MRTQFLRIAPAILFLLLSFVLSAGSNGAQATPSVKVKILETAPPGKSVSIGLNQNFYVRIQYEAVVPTDIWARPYFQGREVNAASNASTQHSGRGEALGWFAFSQPTKVDEIRIKVDGDNGYGKVALSYPVDITVSANAAPSVGKPAWVDDLIQQDAELQKKAAAHAASSSNPVADSIFLFGFMLFMLLILVLSLAAPVWAFWKWRGGWRIAAAVPVCLMAFVVLRIVMGTSADPTSHNLWPFEILINGAFALVIICVLWLVRKLSLRNTG